MKIADIFKKIIGKDERKEGPLRIKYLFIFGMRFIRRIYLDDYVSTDTLNALMDIRNVPPARGKLRRLQLIDLKLLQIFGAICCKYEIPYFLYAGTLLGAVRHGGFTPWDDDIDVCVPREQYRGLMKILETELRDTNIKIYGIEDTRLGDGTLRLSHRQLPESNLDVFYAYGHKATEEDRASIFNAWTKAHKNYESLYKRLQESQETKESISAFISECDSYYQEMLPERLKYSDKNATYFSSEISWHTFRYFPSSFVYPLKDISFEGYDFPAPCNPDLFLKEFYGNYMSFPPTFAHHGNTFTRFDEKMLDTVEKDLDAILLRYRGV